ncbi:MAG: LacI family transcriptional regulator [Chloroflexi bacterium]|nr:LacI family transcriptional regulator [Chloroflexota bacterium]
MSAITIRDVAKKAGVGVGTVSRVLNSSASVSVATRQKVQDAIQTLNYTPNLTARRLSRGKTMTLGIVVPFFTSPSAVKRLQGVVSVMATSEYDMILFDIEKAEDRETFLQNVVRRKMTDGLLIISFSPNDEDVVRFELAGLPTVLIDAYHPLLSRVVVDNVAGGLIATQHLIELGHQKIAFISDCLDSPFNSPVRDRYTGYRKALRDAGIPFIPQYHQQAIHGREEAVQMGHELLSLPDPPTAVFAYSDTQAIGVLDAARELNRQIPAELSVIGFDNIDTAEFLNLTTVRQSLFDSGVQGAKLLLNQMRMEPSAPQEILLPLELVIRKTTAVYPTKE